MRIAIIGGGISGLVAAYRLGAAHDVTLFEANDYLGGHTNTVDVQDGERSIAVDTGFIVYNDRTYPEFCRLLDELGVRGRPTTMSFSVKDADADFEYRGMDLGGLFAQKSNAVRPAFWRMLYDFVRFRRVAVTLVDEDESVTVGRFLRDHRFSREFIDHYFLPMGSAVWSCPRATFEQFPIRFIIDFYRNHGMLGVQQRPQWRVVEGGSREYVRALVPRLRAKIRTSCPVREITRSPEGVLVRTHEDGAERFDHVVNACHADIALKMLGRSATPVERELLTRFPYERNEVVLHTDSSILPRRRKAWAAWNYHVRGDREEKASVTYDMNLLQGIRSDVTYCVTLNDTSRIDPDRILRVFHYDHPLFQPGRRVYQGRHDELIGHEGISYCGAYWSNGFHEDGVRSALRVVERIGEFPLPCPAVSARAVSST